MRSTVDQLDLVAEGRVQVFDGDLNDYEQWLFDFRRQQTMPISSSQELEVSRKEQRQLDAKQRELRRPLLSQIKKSEDELEKLQEKISKIELMLAEAVLYEDHNKDKLRENMFRAS